MELKKEFQGIVKEIYKDTFMADLIDLSDNTKYFAEIITEKISQTERKHIQNGAVFSWKIYEDNNEGISEFKFNILGHWTKEEIDKCKEKAKELYNFFNERE